MLPNRAELEEASELVHRTVPPTPQYVWPLLSRRAGKEVWVKHENHTPVGAFKIRGGLTFFDHLRRSRPDVTGVITATRGNHGQSVALAAGRSGIRSTIVVPEGNSVEKNAAMRALGAELVVEGEDFQAAAEHARRLSAERGLYMVPSFHPMLVRGVATYSLEFLSAVPDLDTVYVPIGLGSGICGMAAAREALGLRTRIVGVVAEDAPAYALSFERRAPVSHAVSTLIADGMACRTPVEAALEIIWRHVERIVRVTDREIEAAMRALFQDTHNVAEGAGAAGFAALLKDRDRPATHKAGFVLTGGNVDADMFAKILGHHDLDAG